MKYQISKFRSENLLILDCPEAMQHNAAPLPPHTGRHHPLPPWCPTLNRIRASTELFTHEFLILMVTPIFHIWIPNYNLSKSKAPHPSPIFKISPGDTWPQLLLTNFLSCKPSSVQVKSPQATFTNYHKQDFSLLAQTSIHRDKTIFFTLDRPSIIKI